jgi:hypothetical protein
MNDYLNRVGRPAAQPAPAGGTAPHAGGGSKKPKKSIFGNGGKIIITTLLVSITILVVALVVYAIVLKPNNISDEIKTDQYQAVFLNSADGQVYFGKLEVFNGDFFKLTDIYYVRVQQVQPDKDNSAAAQNNISLAKLGSEIHGPEDVMYINRDDVMFWENLKEDGQVVTAIRQYQTSGQQNTNNQQQAPSNQENTQQNTNPAP